MTTDLWAPYTPDDQAPWDLRRVVHLHRRAGFAATWAELQRDLREGPPAGPRPVRRAAQRLRPRAGPAGVAGRPGQPQGPPEREPGPRADGTVHPGPGTLHRGRRERGGPGADRLGHRGRRLPREA